MKFNVKDANGKEFVLNTKDLCTVVSDFSSDSLMTENGITTNPSDETIIKHDVQIVDSNGNAIDVLALKDEVAKDKNVLPSAIDVLVEATHSGINRNGWNYHSDSMALDANSFINPFKKPLLKNHNMGSEPMGRVKDAYFSASEIDSTRDCINLVFRVTDKDAIEKFLDGRYQTFSISGNPGKITCGICGKDILKDGVVNFCGHWRNETYKGQKAIWNATDISYDECSVVNDPADSYAQVKKITIVENEGNNDSVENDNGINDMLNDIDNAIINDSVNENEQPKDTNIEDNIENSESENTSSDNENNEEAVNDNNDKSQDKIIQELQDSLNEKENALVSKDAEIVVLNETIAELNYAKKELEDKNTSLTSDIAVLSDKLATSDSKFVKLAKMQKELLVSRVLDYEILKGITLSDNKEDRHKELNNKNSVELSAIYDGFNIEKIVPAITGKVTNPAHVNVNDKNAINTSTEDSEEVENKQQIEDNSSSTYKNYIDSAIESLFK